MWRLYTICNPDTSIPDSSIKMKLRRSIYITNLYMQNKTMYRGESRREYRCDSFPAN